jgi:hypothetical protein
VNEALCWLSYAGPVVEPPGFAPGFRVYQTRVLLLDDGSVAPQAGDVSEAGAQRFPATLRLTAGRSTS